MRREEYKEKGYENQMQASLALTTLPVATPPPAPLAARLVVRAWQMRLTVNGYEKGGN